MSNDPVQRICQQNKVNDLLTYFASRSPHLRIGQIIENARLSFKKTKNMDLFYIENELFIEMLKNFEHIINKG